MIGFMNVALYLIKRGYTPMQYAILGGNLEIVKIFCQCGADLFHKSHVINFIL